MEIGKNAKAPLTQGSRVLWSEVEAGVFVDTNVSEVTLPAGTYRSLMRYEFGKLCLVRVASQNDEALLLPDPIVANPITEAQRFWHAGDDFRRLGFVHKRGFLLMGPAGCGKTSIINQVADYVLGQLAGLVLIVDDPERAAMVLAKIRQLEPERPVLVVIEDIEAMLGHGREEHLLSLLDGQTLVDHVLFIATTNYPERLDRRLQARPSRFDRVEIIRPPSAEVRQAYLEKRIPGLSAAEIERWVELSAGFSVAHLKELILAVRCFGADLSATAERLKAGLEQTPTSGKFIPARMGFKRTDS